MRQAMIALKNPMTIPWTAVLLLILIFAGSAQANEIKGVTFNNSYIDDGFAMQLQGMGKKNVLFITAFVAAFYRDNSFRAGELGEYPMRIEVEYFVNIPRQKLNNFTIETMKDNIGKDELSELKKEVEQMGKYFADLKPSDRFSLTYIPGVGTKFAHNGEVIGVIAGKKFARALFSVWLGEKPFDKSLKQQILGKSTDQDVRENRIAMK